MSFCYRKVPKVTTLEFILSELATFGARYFREVVTFGEREHLNKAYASSFSDQK